MRGDESWRSVTRHDENIVLLRVSKANVAVGVENIVVMENVICAYKSIELESLV
jgi:hypothetical protein